MKKSVDLLGKYHLLEQLGEGGFAEVYLGEHIHLGTHAAIKVLRTSLYASQVQRFRSEAQTIARLLHPHIIRLLDYDVQDGIPFLVMDYAPHGSLRERHPYGSRLPLSRILHYLQPLASAVQYAHDQGMIHCDLKPENILLGPQQIIWLSDFGLAIEQATRSRERSSQAVAGTISYMAPEQFQGHPCAASDQYALGVLVYEWLCGCYPFQGDTLIEQATQKLSQPPTPPSAILPDLSPTLEQILLQALATAPQDRFKTVAAFTAALQAVGHHSSASTLLPGSHNNASPSNTFLVRRAQSSPQQNTGPLPRAAAPTAERWSRRALLAGVVGVFAIGITRALTSLPKNHATVVPPTTTASTNPTVLPTSVPTPQATASPTVSPPPSPTSPPPARLPTAPQGTRFLLYTGHTAPCTSVAWSPDGTRIASGGLDTTVQVWDAQKGGTSFFTYRGHTQPVYAVAFSPDGTRIASASSDGTVQVYDAQKGTRLLTYQGHAPQGVHSVAWSADGTRLASGGLDNQIHLWNALSGAIQLRYHSHAQAITSLSWSRDSTRLVSCEGDAQIYLWNAQSGQTLQTLTGLQQLAQATSWSPDGQHIAGCDNNGHLMIWLPSGVQLPGMNFLTGNWPNLVGLQFLCVAWSPDNQQVVLGSQTSASLLQILPTQQGNVFVYTKHSAAVTGVAFSPDGTRIASASTDTTVQIWSAAPH